MLNCWCITWPVGFKRLIRCTRNFSKDVSRTRVKCKSLISVSFPKIQFMLISGNRGACWLSDACGYQEGYTTSGSGPSWRKRNCRWLKGIITRPTDGGFLYSCDSENYIYIYTHTHTHTNVVGHVIHVILSNWMCSDSATGWCENWHSCRIKARSFKRFRISFTQVFITV